MSNNIIFTDGFDNYSTVLDKWDNYFAINGGGGSTPGEPTIVPGAGRGGAGALLVGQSSQGGNNATTGTGVIKNIGAHSTIYVGFAMNWNPLNQVGTMEILRFTDGTVAQVALRLDPSGIFSFSSGGDSAASSGVATTAIGSPAGFAFPSNSFHYVEVEVVISATVGIANLYVDGVAWLTQSGLNTKFTSNTYMTSIHFCQLIMGTLTNQRTGSLYLDDAYIDTLGFNGDNRINGQLPNGDGSTQNFSNVAVTWAAATVEAVGNTIFDGTNLQRVVAVTGDAKTGPTTAPTWATSIGVNTTDNHVTWTCLGTPAQYKYVNEPNPDGDNSYIKSNNVGDISRFTFPAIPSGAVIKAVIIWPNMRKDDGGVRTVRGHIKSGSSTGDTGTDVSPGGQYQYQALISATDPATGNPWTASGVNAAEFGIKITS